MLALHQYKIRHSLIKTKDLAGLSEDKTSILLLQNANERLITPQWHNVFQIAGGCWARC